MAERDDEALLTAAHAAGLVDLDAATADCPRCGERLRFEIREQWRSLEDASRAYGVQVTRDDVLGAGGKLDTFGRVKAGVPYVFCFACGFEADASHAPERGNSGEGGE